MVIRKRNIEKEIIIGYSNLRISLPVFIALEKKLFKRYGLNNVVLQKFNTAEELTNSIIENNDISFGGYCALPIAFNTISKHNVNLTFIGAIFEDDNHPISFLISRNDIEINDLKELENYKIGYFPTTAYKSWLKKILQLNCPNYKNKNLVRLEIDKQLSSLQNGDIDVIFTNDPEATRIISKGIGKLVTPDNQAIIPDILDRNPFYFGSFIANNNFVLENTYTTKSISRALDEAIKIIRNSKESRHLINNVLDKYLGYGESIINELKLCNYKKTNEVKNITLDKTRQYYFDQNILNRKIVTSNLQYKRNNLFGFVRDIYSNWEKTFEKKKALIVPIGFILSTLISYCSSNISTKNSISSQVEQFQEKLIQDRKSIPAQFLLKYIKDEKQSDKNNYSVYLSNIGNSTLINIKADIEYYFISKSDEILLASVLHSSISNELFNELITKTKYKSRSQLNIDLNDYRDIDVSNYLPPTKEKNFNQIDYSNDISSVTFDNSSSIIRNAILINEALETILIARWKISYFEEISKEKKVVYKYMWFSQDEAIYDKYGGLVVDLTEILGSQKIVNLISDYEKNSKDVIFE